MKLFNRAKLAASYWLKRPSVWGLPVEASIEVTTHCNLACPMCPRTFINRPLKEMDFSLFKKIIDEMKDSVELVYLHGLGEPLLCSRLFKFLNYAKSQRVPVGISTNATLLNTEKAKRLIQSGLDYLIFSIDAATKKTYEKVRVRGDFEQVEKNIKNFLRIKESNRDPSGGNHPFVVLQFVVMPKNENEVNLFLKKWRDSGVNAIRIKPVIDYFASRASTPARCLYPYRMINIFFDGKVIPCCEDGFGRYVLGNIKEKSLEEIWNGPKAQYLRQKLNAKSRDKIILCRQCHFPQPSVLGILGTTLFDSLKVKKILPLLERLPIFREKLIIYD